MYGVRNETEKCWMVSVCLRIVVYTAKLEATSESPCEFIITIAPKSGRTTGHASTSTVEPHIQACSVFGQTS